VTENFHRVADDDKGIGGDLGHDCFKSASQNRRYALPPPLPTGKSAVRSAPAPAGWKTGGTSCPRPCRLENRRYTPPLAARKFCQAL